MLFAIRGLEISPGLKDFARGLRDVLERHDHRFVEDPDRADLVFNLFPADDVETFRRKSRAVFVTGVTRLPERLEDPVDQGYPILVRSLSNLLILTDGSDSEGTEAHFLTPERGHYVVRGNGADDPAYFEQIYRRIAPLASSTLVIDNVFEDNLPAELWEGDETTRSLTRAGERLDELELLPTPFPLEETLSSHDLRHLEKLFGIGGLSYGNLSARRDEDTFWMSASGVDKSRLREVGREILLVAGYDQDRNAMRIKVPPHVENPRRASVDAIEHWMIYREHPEVGAILHVHAWMEGIPSTSFNYPCGTYELAEAVAEKVREAPDPSRAVVGLKNHGLTITGRSLDEIFDRVEGRLQRQVPMS